MTAQTINDRRKKILKECDLSRRPLFGDILYLLYIYIKILYI